MSVFIYMATSKSKALKKVGEKKDVKSYTFWSKYPKTKVKK